MVIKRDFVLKGIEQFGRSSQDLNLEYKKYLVLLFWKQMVLVVPVEKKMGEWQGQIKEEPGVSL
jgi:hypothetical protein